jgi:hypothetical protein
MASTYPIEVIQAARWSRANPGITGDAAVRAVEQQPWDPSVKSLVAFPQILSMMDEKLDWMQRLGDAFLSQQQQVMDTVQQLRQKAQMAGNLKSNDNIRVEPQGQTIVIEQANPQVVYVPYYDPTYIYGPWWYPAYPPVYWGPWPGYYARPGFGAGFFWGVGITIGAGFYFGAFDWPHHHVAVVNVNNFYYRPPVRPVGPPGGWQHDPYHRRGVPYRDPVLRQEFARPGSVGRPDERREFRGNPPQRVQGPAARPGVPNVSGSNRPEPRDRLQPRPDGNVRPNIPDSGRPEPRNIPAQSNANAAANRPDRMTANPVPNRPNVPAQPGATPHPAPNAPPVRVAPVVRAPVEAHPRLFEGVGHGSVVRDSSQRGNASTQRMAPAGRPQAPPQPAARIAPAQRSGGGGHGNSEGQRQQH